MTTTPSPEALAELIREKSRFPSGVARMSKALALEIAREALATPPHRPPDEPVGEPGSYPKSVWYTPEDNSSRKYIRDDIAEGWKEACNNLVAGSADDRDRALLLTGVLQRAREYVADALDAHEHSDGRQLLNEIDAALLPTPVAAPVGDEALVERVAGLEWPAGERFTFHDDPGEHEPCYVVMPGGGAIPLNHHDRNGVDQARARFIVNACNAALFPRAAIQAIPTPATGEREQIVGWLRGMKDAPGLPAFGFKPHYLQGIYADGFADAIARGDHRTQSGEMEGGEHG
jgi:hypothetical protein